ncbi:hypothetical protein SUGI_0732640 [Cryptomeria japonica]|nr:hypothetical protein SUGI_0732640 [Cryptomeria japonica]
MYQRSRHEVQINGVRQSLSGITNVEFVADGVVEFEHSSTITPEQIGNELKKLRLRPTLLTQRCVCGRAGGCRTGGRIGPGRAGRMQKRSASGQGGDAGEADQRADRCRGGVRAVDAGWRIEALPQKRSVGGQGGEAGEVGDWLAGGRADAGEDRGGVRTVAAGLPGKIEALPDGWGGMNLPDDHGGGQAGWHMQGRWAIWPDEGRWTDWP